MRTAFGSAVGLLAVLLAAEGRASLYHPDDRTGVVPVDEKGAPEPFPFGELQRRRLVLRNVLNPDWPLVRLDPKTKQPVLDPRTKQPIPNDRGLVDARIRKALAKPPEARTEAERVALAVDLLRFGRPDDADGALRGLRSGFLPNVTLAHVAAAQGQWDRAADFLDIANEEAPPAALAAKEPKLLAWQRKLDRGALMALMKLREKEQSHKKGGPDALPPEAELPDQIWPVRFVNGAGKYEPGVLAAAEKAKLPGGDFREPIATVQQLVLWFPADVRLYWLLGELYAAKGEFDSALKVMNECVDSGRYSNRKALMEHRELVAQAARAAKVQEPPDELAAPAAKADDVAPPPEQPVPVSMDAVWVYFGVVGAVALFAFVRAATKRSKSGGACGPAG
jgi:hypothetical protein